MEGQDCLLDTIFDEEDFEDGNDIEMLDVEEGELIERIPKIRVGDCSTVDNIQESRESDCMNSTIKKETKKKKKKKKKNKRKRGSCTGPNITNINRFVIDACNRLKERRSYLMYTAVGCLGVAALSDLIKEVDAIQACGGHKTAKGHRFQNGSGIFWNLVKVRDPNAYKEIMAKGKEFEKQFKKQNEEPEQPTETSDNSRTGDASKLNGNPPDDLGLIQLSQSQLNSSTGGEKRASVHNRIRMPVTYDDDLLFGEEDVKDKSSDLRE